MLVKHRGVNLVASTRCSVPVLFEKALVDCPNQEMRVMKALEAEVYPNGGRYQATLRP